MFQIKTVSLEITSEFSVFKFPTGQSLLGLALDFRVRPVALFPNCYPCFVSWVEVVASGLFRLLFSAWNLWPTNKVGWGLSGPSILSCLTENCKSLLNEVRHKWESLYSWIGRLIIVKIWAQPNRIYRFSVVPIRIPIMVFIEVEKSTPKFMWHFERFPNSLVSWFQNIIQNCSNQNSAVLAWRQMNTRTNGIE